MNSFITRERERESDAEKDREKDRNIHPCGDGHRVREGDMGQMHRGKEARKKNERPKHSKEKQTNN